MPVILKDVIQARVNIDPSAVALLALQGKPLTYAALEAQLTFVAGHLRALGIHRNDRVAIVLPNGPEMATAFLSVAAVATSAPLNPAYRVSEFDFYLADLNAKALLIPEGLDSPVRQVAHDRGIPIIEIRMSPDAAAGAFTFVHEVSSLIESLAYAQADDIALVLHTSGTTSRPKIVPLTHRNLVVSARNIVQALQLSPADRCLNIMPLFHIHGLVGGVLASLMAGSNIVCTPGFDAPRFFDWLSGFRPTWYTAVPSMHQAILARAELYPSSIADVPLRFIRSSSAALPPQVMAGLESVLRVPVVEAYGMTEAAHQMASNPLPPRGRKPGSVGLAAGPEVAIMDEAGNLLSAGQLGEVVIRGENVTRGYENNATANRSAFHQGWFRTGDQGYLDEENYLFLTGRLKELINRGGEKISPREVDEVLLNHPAVAQVVTFALPHHTLGEAVAAAVVLKSAAQLSSLSLREFAARYLADFKVPERIVFLDEIPKGPTGKLQRIGLAEKLGLTGQPSGSALIDKYVAPADSTEEKLAAIWAEVLRVERVGTQDRFLSLGGDSILAAKILARVRNTFQVDISFVRFFESPTVASQAVVIREGEALETADTEEMAQLLDELQNLSDEEITRLLKAARKNDSPI